jgi:hypothetical protein
MNEIQLISINTRYLYSNKDEIDKFKEEFIYFEISKNEVEKGVFDEWCRTVDCCSFDYDWYLRDGVVVPEAKPEYLFQKTGPIVPGKVSSTTRVVDAMKKEIEVVDSEIIPNQDR